MNRSKSKIAEIETAKIEKCLYYIKSFNLVTLCDLVTVFAEAKSLTKSLNHEWCPQAKNILCRCNNPELCSAVGI